MQRRRYNRLWLLLLLLCTSFWSRSQSSDSCHLRISVLTCAPGEELYSTFGHTAMRVIDSATFSDVVFNYGTFDFSDPDFYAKFVRGKLNYFLSAERYSEFIRFYQYEQRSVSEQVLDISCEAKNRMYKALQVNLQDDNKYYKYDFLFDNCTSRVRDMVEQQNSGLTITTSLTPPRTSFRNMLHTYLDKGGQPWSKLGIDILLGSKLDDTVTVQQSMFLPDYLEKGLNTSVLPGNKPIVSETLPLVQAVPPVSPQNKWIPLLVFSLFSFVILLLSQLKNRTARFITRLIDSLLLYTTGVAGFLLLFMWFGTDHVVCSSNYNLLWALPTHFIAAFFIWKRSPRVRKYFRFAGFLQIALLLGWLFLPQHLNIALVPIVLLMAYRCFQLAADE
ncbi:Lnb N-terminal periplasmic domain-containing protein [Filimonas effusa]|uniref:DUF4105 domain-containing protein n=1 Tax=Filimonas effusa TaxID=2508721 RepID=A0A4Q1D2U3_9BACT|nr:DUF4105 domain-containing protein [Filimonas effusa]RXK81401.1 DUF4105 domain-containing protein [Filimonas effusa]